MNPDSGVTSMKIMLDLSTRGQYGLPLTVENFILELAITFNVKKMFDLQTGEMILIISPKKSGQEEG